MLAEMTVEQRSQADSALKFYSSWFCPYAQRAWIALEEKGVEYQYVEVDPYKAGDNGAYTKTPLSIEEKRARYPAFVAASPRGLVPAIDNAGELVCESVVCVEYIDEAFSGPAVLPATAGMRAKARMWTVHLNERVIPHFYKALMLPLDQRQTAIQAFIDGTRTWTLAMAPEADGPFFFGSHFSIVDIVFLPWMQRSLSVLKVYRGFSWPDAAEFERLSVWWEAMRKRPSVAATIGDEAKLISNYANYADGTATSDVAVRLVTTAGTRGAGDR